MAEPFHQPAPIFSPTTPIFINHPPYSSITPIFINIHQSLRIFINHPPYSSITPNIHLSSPTFINYPQYSSTIPIFINHPPYSAIIFILKKKHNQIVSIIPCDTSREHIFLNYFLESPKVAVTTPTEASPSPPPLNLKLPATPSQETDCSEFPTSPSQETDCSELSPTPLQGTEHSEPPTTPRSQESDDREYDILVCCSLKDREVAFELRKVMLDEFHLRVCIDELDFVPGNAISDNICDFIRCSKAIVFLLTPDFLEKKWARWEMQQATLDLLSNRSTKKIVPVILRKCDVPQELQPYTPLNFQQLESGATITTEDWKRLAAAVHGQRLAGSSIMGKLSKLFGKKSPN